MVIVKTNVQLLLLRVISHSTILLRNANQCQLTNQHARAGINSIAQSVIVQTTIQSKVIKQLGGVEIGVEVGLTLRSRLRLRMRLNDNVKGDQPHRVTSLKHLWPPCAPLAAHDWTRPHDACHPQPADLDSAAVTLP
jgi:hypothetical protein